MATADTARLVAELKLDDKGFSQGLSRAEKNLGKFESTAFRVGQNIGSGLKTTANNLAKLGTIGAVGALGIIAKSVGEASDLNEQINKTSAVFDDASQSILDFSKTTAAALGLSQSEALEAAGNFGNMFKTVGLADEQSAEFSKTLVTLASDMASFNNEDPSDMLDRLRSGLSGEAEPLRRFGVLLSEAEVKAEAYRIGLAKEGDALTEAQKVQARYSLILKQTSVQQGDFARTSGSLANQQRILAANLKNAGATIGTALLPKITEMAVKLNKLITENGPAIQDFANKLPGAFDKAVAFAEKIPWGTIASGLESATMWAGKLFDVFLGLPPEVQTTIIALGALNKLSGGAITGIVGELGKGLIKGVLGMTAGVVNIKAATVTGAGGGVVPGPTGGGKVGAAASLLTKVFIVGMAAEVADILEPTTTQAGIDLHDAIFGPNVPKLPSGDELFWPFGNKNAPEWAGGTGFHIEDLGAAFGPPSKQADTVKAHEDAAKLAANQVITNERLESIQGYTSAQSQSASALLRSSERNETALRDSTATGQAAAFAIRDKVGTSGSLIQSAVNSVKTATDATKAAAAAAGQQTAAAIRDKDLSVDVRNVVNVQTNVSVRSTIGATQKVNKYTTIL